MLFPFKIICVKPGTVLIETALSGNPLYYEKWGGRQASFPPSRYVKLKFQWADCWLSNYQNQIIDSPSFCGLVHYILNSVCPKT